MISERNVEARHPRNGPHPTLRRPTIYRLPPPKIHVPEPRACQVRHQVAPHHREVSPPRADHQIRHWLHVLLVDGVFGPFHQVKRVLQWVPAELSGGAQRHREAEDVAVVAGGERGLEPGSRVDDAEHAHLLLRVRAEGDGAAAPEAGGEELEGGAGAEVGREEAAEGGELGGAEEEGAMFHVIEGDDGAFGVGHFVVLVVRARHARRVSSIEKLPAPHGWNRRGGGATRHLPHCAHELDEASRVAHGMVQPQPKDEASALEPCHLSNPWSTMA